MIYKISNEKWQLFCFLSFVECKEKIEKAYLTDTCLAAQDEFKKYPDYFKIYY